MICSHCLQCWTSVRKNYGINVCPLMSMMSNQLMPSACEVDITGVVSMYALQLASGVPSALADWNNNYADDPDRCVLFHCGNWAKAFMPEIEIKTAPILGTTIGEENTYGAMAGRAAAGPMTYARVSTDEWPGSCAPMWARANSPKMLWILLGTGRWFRCGFAGFAGISVQEWL